MTASNAGPDLLSDHNEPTVNDNGTSRGTNPPAVKTIDEDFRTFSASARSLDVHSEKADSVRSCGVSSRSIGSQSNLGGKEDSFRSARGALAKQDSHGTFQSAADEISIDDVPLTPECFKVKVKLPDAADARESPVEGETAEENGTASAPQSQKQRYVTPKDFELLKVIGMGAFGKVLQVRNRESRQILAMKVISKRLLKRKVSYVENVHAERDILTKIGHPFVVSMHCSFQTREKLFIIMDFLAGGELFLRLGRAGVFLEKTAAFYVAEIVLALEHLHSRGILHRDLKPENILLGSDGHLCLTDFGLAKDFSTDDVTENGDGGDALEGGRARTICGTQEYMAPEMIARKGYGKAADYWSLGCISYEMLAGEPPFQSKKGSKDLFRKIMNERVRMPDGSSAAACRLLKGLLNRNALSRLGAARGTMFQVGGVAELKQVDFFAGLDWGLLEEKKIDPPENLDVDHDEDLRHFHDEFTNMTVPRSVTEMSKADFQPRRCESDQFRGFSFIQDDFVLPERPEEEHENYWNNVDADGESVSDCASSKLGDDIQPNDSVDPPSTEKKKRPPRKKKKKKGIASPTPSEAPSEATTAQADEMPSISEEDSKPQAGSMKLLSLAEIKAAVSKNALPKESPRKESPPKENPPNREPVTKHQSQSVVSRKKEDRPKWETVGKAAPGIKSSNVASKPAQVQKTGLVPQNPLPQSNRVPVGIQPHAKTTPHQSARGQSSPNASSQAQKSGNPPAARAVGSDASSSGAARQVPVKQAYNPPPGSWAAKTAKKSSATAHQRPPPKDTIFANKTPHQTQRMGPTPGMRGVGAGHPPPPSSPDRRDHIPKNQPQSKSPMSPDWRDHKMKYKKTSTPRPLPPPAPDLWPSLGDFPPPGGNAGTKTAGTKTARPGTVAPKKAPQGTWAKATKQAPKPKAVPKANAWGAVPTTDSDAW